MASNNNYIKLPNQGNISSNIRLLYEMKLASDYADANGYYSKKNIAEIGANALLITTSNKVGNAVLSSINSNDVDEGDNSPLQNAKMRMQILRILGLVSADYYSEMYAITEIGEMMASDKLSTTCKKRILLELFLGIESSSECYNFTCSEGFHCFLGLEICLAFSSLNYHIAVDEMPVITTYDYREIDDFISDVKVYREMGKPFPETHPHYPKTNSGKPLKQASNLTRTINQILRYCGIIKSKNVYCGGKRFYECTDFGKEYVDKIAKGWRAKKLSLLTPYAFRKMNVLDQLETCQRGLQNIYTRAGLDIKQKDNGLYFSPYQMLSETSANWFLGRKIRKHPVKAEVKVSVINNAVSARDLRLRTFLKQACDERLKEMAQDEILVANMLACKTDEEKKAFVQTEIKKHESDDKTVFYPYIHSLLKVLGLDCHGEIGRYDAYTIYDNHIIPVEIKSATEVYSYNQKGVRQAIENKICSFNPSEPNDMAYASLVVGYAHPDNDGDIKLLIDRAKEQYGIKIIACDLKGLLTLCLDMVTQNLQLDLEQLLTNYGFII